MRVNFLVAGVQKGGTSSLHAYLCQHPQICMAAKKELHFFDDEQYPGGPDYSLYHEAFEPKPGTLAVGEATPIYTYWPCALRRIRDYNPRMRLVVSLRNPVLRAWSQWKMEFNRHDERLDFPQAIAAEPQRLAAAYPLKPRYHSYVDRGRYPGQILELWKLFPRAQVLLLKSEDFFAAPQATLARICRFLGVADFAFDVRLVHHAGVGPSAPEPQHRRMVRDLLRQDILHTQDLLGWDCRDWLA